MATVTVTQFVTRTLASTPSASATNRATPQGGVFEGVNPSHYDTKNPIVLFIIQASIVVILTRILHFPLSKLRQPRVIAEVITGIILGPSIMGRIPGFSSAIFPTASMPAFSLAANIGLVLFLFLVGLEVDLRFLVSNWRIALSVGAAGMAIPFGLGCAIAYGLYHEFRNEEGLAPIGFGVYLLFIGVAMAITAFPVLCRILTSLKLLSTDVGVIVLSAGVGNDIVGWILLALCVALVNSGAGLSALWILLVSIGYILFMVYAIRPAFIYVLRRTGSLANGPTQGVVALTVLLVFASSFFTALIGIHAIFGAFIVGLLIPHESGFAIKLTEKLEDLVSVLFLPLYFTLSGLDTNLGLLDNGITWAYVVGVCAIAFFGKIAGGTLASRLNGLVWRESLTIGCLMSCKGLVELIVLNIGLQAKILNTRTFTIFVVMALVTTFATTPLTTWLYPPWYQRKLALWKKGKIDWDGNILHPDEGSVTSEDNSLHKYRATRKILVYLRLDGLPALFTIVSLLGGAQESAIPPALPSPATERQEPTPESLLKYATANQSTATLSRPTQVHGLRLMELTERTSAVMKVSEIEEYAARDPIIKAFGTFGQSRNIAVGGQIAVVPEHSFSGTLHHRARELGSDLILLPWSETGTMSEYPSLFDEKPDTPLQNRQFTNLVLDLFDQAKASCNVGVMLDKTVLARHADHNDHLPQSPNYDRPTRQLSRTLTGMGLGAAMNSTVHFKSSDSSRQRIVVPYTSGQDDLYAVKLALQLGKNERVDVKIIYAPATSSGAGTNPKQRNEDDTSNGDQAHPELDADLEMLRVSVPDDMQHRVEFITAETLSAPMGGDHVAPTNTPTIQPLLNLLSEPCAAETLLILGRSLSANPNTSHNYSTLTSPNVASSTAGPSSSLHIHADVKVLGLKATETLNAVRDADIQASLLVVQCRVEGEDEKGKERFIAGGGEKGVAVIVGSDGARLSRKRSNESCAS